MPPPFRRSLPIAGVAVLMTAALALADPPVGAAPHVRPETDDALAMLRELTTHSPTAWHLVESIEQSNIIVYIRHRVFTATTLNGRIGLLRSEQTTSFLILELAAGRPTVEQLVALAHELQHAAEIASLGCAVSPAGLAEYYTAIGEATSPRGEPRTFETQAALKTSIQVRRELLGTSVRTTHDQQ